MVIFLGPMAVRCALWRAVAEQVANGHADLRRSKMNDALATYVPAMLDGLTLLFDLSAIIMLFVGLAVGLVMGVLPGLGGTVTMALLLPFTYGLEPASALALVLGAFSAVSMGGSIPAILMNAPGTGEQAVTSLDGYPMTQRGEGARALAAAAAAGVLGTLVGVIALTVLIPFVRMILMAVGSAEMFALSLLGVLAIGVLTTDSVTRGLLSGLIGLMLSTIGSDPVTGTLRYTAGSVYLHDGLSITGLTLGLFAIAEMIRVFAGGKPIAAAAVGHETNIMAGIRDGVRDCARNVRTVISGGIIGSVIGLIPGMGGTVAMFLSYGSAKQRSKHPERFGKGAVEGIIAAEAANNAKEGGGLVPTLAFGIPGGSTMAVFIGVLFIIGLPPGPELMNKNLHMVYYMAWSLALAGILGSVIGLGLAPQVSRLARMPSEILAPLLIAFSIAGAVVDTRLVFGVYVAIAAGFLGYWLQILGYSCAGITLGYLLGPVVERKMFISINAYGLDFFTRPLTLIILATIVLLAARPYLGRLWERRKRPAGETVSREGEPR
jgi:putative tricarboxylic transport membrane protein